MIQARQNQSPRSLQRLTRQIQGGVARQFPRRGMEGKGLYAQFSLFGQPQVPCIFEVPAQDGDKGGIHGFGKCQFSQDLRG